MLSSDESYLVIKVTQWWELLCDERWNCQRSEKEWWLVTFRMWRCFLQMLPQVACPRWLIVTLGALVWLFSSVSPSHSNINIAVFGIMLFRTLINHHLFQFLNLNWEIKGRYQTLPLVPKVPFFSDIDDYQSFQVWGYKPRGSPCELYTLIITCQGHISNVKVMSSHL